MSSELIQELSAFEGFVSSLSRTMCVYWDIVPPAHFRHQKNLKKVNLGIDNPWVLVYNIACSAADTAKQTEYGRMAQLVEHRVHIAGVTGSSPVATTKFPIRYGRGFFCNT